MPARFWGDTQQARYGRFPEAVARGEFLCAIPIPNRTFATSYVSKPFLSHARSALQRENPVIESGTYLLRQLVTDPSQHFAPSRRLVAIFVEPEGSRTTAGEVFPFRGLRLPSGRKRAT